MATLDQTVTLRTEATAEDEKDRRSLVLRELHSASYYPWTA